MAMEQSGLAPGNLLIVAVSGGPDSLALLHTLYHLREDLHLSLHGAHLDHGLRGDASKSDALFVAEAFRRLGIAFTLEEADVPSFRKKHRLSLEEAAREVRYDFLARVCLEQGAHAVALGHTSDDQAETILMHIVRGTGLTGLRGMETVTHRAFSGSEVVLVRPMLSLSRSETAHYCRVLKLEPRQDESNLSRELTRNQIRMELVPLLETYNPAIRDALVRLSRSAAQEIAYMEGEIDEIWHKTVHQDQGRVSVNRETFRPLAQALQNHLLRRVILTAKGDLKDVEQIHIDDMVRLMAGPAGRSLDLPGGIRFSVSYYEATLATSESDLRPLPPLGGQHTLKIPGETLIPGWLITADVVEQERDTENHPSAHTAHLSYDIVGEQLWVRPRRPGDRFQPLGMSQPKKLQDFMVDSKIPRPWRDRVPLVESPRGIIWVVGWRVAEWAKVRDKEAPRLKLRLLPR